MVDILLATYNSEKYLETQINSIINQTYSNWRLMIRDDGSNDKTIDIIRGYIDKYQDKVILIKDDVKCKSAKLNFIELMKHATSEYIMFCDHDDFWMEDKIEVSLKAMQDCEKQNSSKLPILAYTKFMVVDEKLNKMAQDKKLQTTNPQLSFNKLLVQNYIPGCTMMCNKALYSNIGYPGNEMLMHDWWLALYASAFGKIISVDKETMKYRQHGDNCVGAVDVKSLNYVFMKLKDNGTKSAYDKLFKQAGLFDKFYSNRLDHENYNILHTFLSMEKSNKFRKIYITLKGKYTKSNFTRILGQLYYI